MKERKRGEGNKKTGGKAAEREKVDKREVRNEI